MTTFYPPDTFSVVKMIAEFIYADLKKAFRQGEINTFSDRSLVSKITMRLCSAVSSIGPMHDMQQEAYACL